MSDRVFRLAVEAEEIPLTLVAPSFEEIQRRYSTRDGAYYLYLRTPMTSGEHELVVYQQQRQASVRIQVRSLNELRKTQQFNGATLAAGVKVRVDKKPPDAARFTCVRSRRRRDPFLAVAR